MVGSRRMEGLLLLLLALFTVGYCQNAPVINKTVVEVREDLQIGKLAFTIEANDTDGDPLTYRIEDDKGHFNVSLNTGEVYIKNPLDREVEEVFRVKVTVSDGVLATEEFVNIIILDANDNAPTFQNTPYNTALPENTTVGTTVFIVTATDADLHGAAVVTYRIQEVWPPEGSSMFSISEEHGYIVLKEPLSYKDKSTFYQLKINATDGGGPLFDDPNYVQSTTVNVSITVIDVPDHDPQFLNLPNTITVKENSPLGTSVYKVQARDPDTGVNDIIYYSIEDTNAPDLFQISQTDGTVTIKSPIDREALLHINAVVKLTVKATEANINVNGIHASTTSTLEIMIADENDNKPVFYKCNGDVCTESNSFSGDLDEHSNTPLFCDECQVSIQENNKLELKVEARDDDQPNTPNSKIQYAIVDGAHSTNFTIDPDTGQLKSHGVLDREAIDLELNGVIRLNITATDMGTPPLSSWTMAVINVDDVNDTPPLLPEIIMEVKENINPPNEIIGQIIGSDVDTNHSLTYDLVSTNCYCNSTWAVCVEEWFILESSGTVKTSPDYTIDYEKCTEVEMKVRVVDLYTEKNRNSTEGIVTIKILDVNDNAPEFIQLEDFFAVVPEDVKQHSSVASVYAQDKDSGENKKMTFKVEAVEFVSYTSGEKPESIDLIFYADANVEVDELQNYKAVIRSQQSLNPKNRGKYIMKVVAVNGELSTATTIELFTVYDNFIVGLQFNSPEEEIRQNLDVIKGALSGATKAMVHVVKVSTVTIGRRKVTLVEAYFVYPDGTALDSASVDKTLREAPEEYRQILQQLGYDGVKLPSEQEDNTLVIIIGTVVPVVLIVCGIATAFVVRKKKKEAKSKKTTKEDQKGVSVVSNTKQSDETKSQRSIELVITMDKNEKDTMPMMEKKNSIIETPNFTKTNPALSTTGI